MQMLINLDMYIRVYLIWPMSCDLHKYLQKSPICRIAFSTYSSYHPCFGKGCPIKNSIDIQYPKIKPPCTSFTNICMYMHPYMPIFPHPSTYKYIGHQSCIGWHLYNYQWIDCMLSIKCWYRHNCLFEWIYKN